VETSKAAPKTSKAAPKKLAPKTKAKRRPPAKAPPYRQMTAALAEKRAIHTRDGLPFDSIAFLRTLR
jgi:hypothetical protein